MCQNLIKSVTCYKTYDKTQRKKPHVCGEIFCKTCNDFYPQNHQCYIRPDTGKAPENKHLYIFYDLETRQEKMHHENPEIKIHEPNLCVFQQRCKSCLEIKTGMLCLKCGVRQNVIKDLNVIERFMQYILVIKKAYKSICCIAHNSQGFDVQFILQKRKLCL